VVWGSPQYFSPEQAAGSAPAPASDVYSLGVVMYEMLTGRLPFTAADPTELARLHREMLPPAPRQLNPAIPLALEQILLKVLAKEASQRYRTADQLGRVLANYRYQAGTPPAPLPQPALQPTSSPAASPQPFSANVQPPRSQPVPPGENPLDIDWITIGLGLLALIAVGGLLPFWLWVYFVYNPPLP
jgi:serine/threonine protein kinase